MVVIRLARVGSHKKPKYRFAVADSRRAVKGKFIEIIGHYDPLSKDKKILHIDKEKYNNWMQKGAQPSSTVKGLFARLEKQK